MNFIEDLQDVTSEVESPKSFIYWAGLSAISAVVRNKIWIDKQYYKLYPNTYVMLIAKSGMRKGFPVGLSRRMVDLVGGTRVIAGRNSIQGIIKDLSSTSTVPGTKGPITHSSAFIVSGEFSTSLVKDPDALTILTDLYDGHYNPEWKNTLKSGTESLKGVNLTLLGAMNETHWNDLITGKEITGGFVARCIIVREERRARKNALLRDLKKPFTLEPFVKYLNEIDKLEGRVHLTEPARDEFEEWYNEFEPEKLDDKTGTANRVHDQILKVAMLVALSRRVELIVGKEDITEAMNLCLSASIVAEKLTAGTGSSADSSQIRIVMQELLSAEENKISRTKLLQRHYGDISAVLLDQIIETLDQSGAIDKYRQNHDQWYRLKPEIVDTFNHILNRGKVVPFAKDGEG
jgi:hypothetical protein